MISNRQPWRCRKYCVAIFILVTSIVLYGQLSLAVTIPLTLREPTGIQRNDVYVTNGIPFAASNTITNPAHCRLLKTSGTAATEVPAQFKVLARWGGLTSDSTKPFKMLLTTFKVHALPANAVDSSYALECGDTVVQSSVDPNAIYMMTNDNNYLEFSTGVAQFRLNKNDFNLLDRVIVGGTTLVQPDPSNGFVVVGLNGQGNYRMKTPSAFVIEESGPVRMVVRVEGDYTDTNMSPSTSMKYIVRLTFWAGSSSVEVSHTQWNPRNFGHPFPSYGAPQPYYYKMLKMVLHTQLDPGQKATFGGNVFSNLSPLGATLATRMYPNDKDAYYTYYGAPNALVATSTVPIDLDQTPSNVLDNHFIDVFNDNALAQHVVNTRYDDIFDLRDMSSTQGKGVAAGMQYFWQTNPHDVDIKPNELVIKLAPDASKSPYVYPPYFKTQIQTGTPPGPNNVPPASADYHPWAADPNETSLPQLAAITDTNTWDFQHPDAKWNANANHVLEGASKRNYKILLQFHTGRSLFSLQNEFKAWEDPAFALPSGSYLSSTDAYGYPFVERRNWNTDAPAGLAQAFNRFEKKADILVDSSAGTPGQGQTNDLISCEDLYYTKGGVYGGHRVFGDYYFGNKPWNAGYNNNHYENPGFIQFLRDPSKYEFYRYGELVERHLVYQGTNWTPGLGVNSDFGLAKSEKGMHSGFFTSIGHTFVTSHVFNYFLTGDDDAKDVILARANNLLMEPIPAVWNNAGGERIMSVKNKILAAAWYMTGDDAYKNKIIQWTHAILAGEQANVVAGCFPGTWRNSLAITQDACAYSPWGTARLWDIISRAYLDFHLNDQGLKDLMIRIANNMTTRALYGGTGPDNNYTPYALWQRDGVTAAYRAGGGMSRVNVAQLIDPFAMLSQITGDQQYFNKAMSLLKDQMNYGLGNVSANVNKTNPAQYDPNTCRPYQYPDTQDKAVKPLMFEPLNPMKIAMDNANNSCQGNGGCLTQGVCSGTSNGVCFAGVWSCAYPSTYGSEICDGLDNNCNGQIDEGPNNSPLAQGCYTGPIGSQGVGQCHGGMQSCSSGNWGACVGEVLPNVENCSDSIDNDCDGAVDCNDSDCASACPGNDATMAVLSPDNGATITPGTSMNYSVLVSANPPRQMQVKLYLTDVAPTSQQLTSAVVTMTVNASSSGTVVNFPRVAPTTLKTFYWQVSAAPMSNVVQKSFGPIRSFITANNTQCTVVGQQQSCSVAGAVGACATGIKTCVSTAQGTQYGSCVANQSSAEICSNNVDDDCDGAVDCADSDCANNVSCAMMPSSGNTNAMSIIAANNIVYSAGQTANLSVGTVAHLRVTGSTPTRQVLCYLGDYSPVPLLNYANSGLSLNLVPSTMWLLGSSNLASSSVTFSYQVPNYVTTHPLAVECTVYDSATGQTKNAGTMVININ